jgi:peptide-methionine (S)-S-oxide reductase
MVKALRKFRWGLLIAVPVLAMTALGLRADERDARLVPAPAFDSPKTAGPLQTAVLAGGCFWGVQGVFEHVHGVRQVLSGYAGGEEKTASYHLVGTGQTGHAESVQIAFDPAEVSYGELLRVYFSVAHDPTQLNRQANDVGTQYRSEIFTTDEAQQKVAEAYITQLDAGHAFPDKIVTKVEKLKGFYVAEGYHQDYLVHHPESGYIQYFDLPKIANLKRLFPSSYESTPALVKTGEHS